MKKYILTSPLFQGSVEFGFSDEGFLVFYHNDSYMNAQQQMWLLNKVPRTIELVTPLAQEIKGKLEEIPEDLSFDAFWVKYDKKINRKRCEPLWKKLKDAERLQVLRNIEPYKAYLKRSGWRGQADPEKYLRDRYFETNWNSES